ncbi:hypothetical protein WJX64_02685 [Leifsonia sp. YIM 134122]|uniref:Uncharacterized protein n=1 Tax=Leifsonia stereocauli TaxID=3134136 RepID=A0ABU9W0B5_9MICO
MRAGGGFVEILRTPDRSVSVLVSPGTTLSIETTQVEDDVAATDAAHDIRMSAIPWHESFDVF